ncbi:unnamed protein product, partial [Mycena citricolor]
HCIPRVGSLRSWTTNFGYSRQMSSYVVPLSWVVPYVTPDDYCGLPRLRLFLTF